MKYGPNKIKVDFGSYRHYWRGVKKIGKAQPLYAKVQTPNGEKEIGSLKVGDTIFAVDGSQTTVIGIFPQGNQPVYEIVFSDGSKTRCSDEHLWTVRTRKMKYLEHGFTRTLSLNEIMGSEQEFADKKFKKYEIPLNGVLDIESHDVPLDPYLLGLLLGDGGITGNVVSFSNVESDVLEKLSDKVEKYGCTLHKNSDFNCCYNIKKPEFEYRNPVKTALKDLGLDGLYSKEKFVPDVYKYNSADIRLGILQGLMDTDGSVSIDGQIRFNTASEQLASDVKWIVHSLGGLATIHKDKREEKPSFYLILRLPENIVPVTSAKHLLRFGKHNPNLCRYISEINFVGNEECVCIKIDDESELYLTDEFIVTHNTTMFRDVVKEQYGETRFGLLLSTGNETGYKALDDVYAHETPSWKSFVETIDDLVKNKADNDFKVIAIDTIDEMVAMAMQEVLDVHKARTGKKAKSINDALGGYGAGKKYIEKIINEQITRLERAGYGLVFIGHCKLRDVKEKGESEPYQILTSNLDSTYDNIFADKADIIATFVTDKIVKDNKIASKNRFIVFRDDGYIDSGSRLAGMPDRVPMTAQDYLKAFKDGVQASKNTFATDEDIEEMRKEELADREKSSQAFISMLKEMKQEDDDLTEEEEETLIPIDTLREMMNKRCSELGGTKNELLMATLTRFAPGGNFNKIKDIRELNDLWKELEALN